MLHTSLCNKLTAQNKIVYVPMRDGVELATELWFPETGEGPWPVILVRTAYSIKSQRGYGKLFSSHNYVVAIQDVRGQFDSEGTFELWNHERQDGYDAVEWLAAKSWCDGKVGMVGGSYGGWLQLAAMTKKPPHLVTIIPSVTMGDPCLNHVYPNGMFHLTQHLQAISLFESRYGNGGSNYKLQPGWQNQLDTLPIINLDLLFFGEKNQQWRNHILHKPFDGYWDKSNVLEYLEKTDIPVFLIGGWYDFGGIGTKEAYLHLSKSQNPNIKLLIGPWSHQSLGKSQLGSYNFGEAAQLDIDALKLEWFDYWLKNIENNILKEPLVQVFEVGPNKWTTNNTYPLHLTDTLSMFLAGDLNVNQPNEVQKLIFNKDTIEEGNEMYSYNPKNPTPYLWFNNLPDIDSIINTRSDMLVYESPPFMNDYQVLGPANAKIYASSSAPDTDWIVYYLLLNDKNEIQPIMSRGVTRARYRNPEIGDQPLQTDRIYKYDIDLCHNSFQILKGYKIRVIICSAAFPHFSRNLNTGGDNELGTVYQTAHQKIYHSNTYSSSINFQVKTLEEN